MSSTAVRSLPSPPPAAQLRLLRALFREPQPALDQIARYGPVVGLGAGPLRLAVVGGPAAIRELVSMPPDRFRWNHRFNLLAVVVGEGSMIVSDGDEHRRRRSSVQAAFSRRRLARWIPMILTRTDAAIDRAVDGTSSRIDLYELGRELVLEIVVHALFGRRMADDHAAELGDLFRRAQYYLELPAYRQLPHPFPVGRRGRVRADRAQFDRIVDTEIANRRGAPIEDPFDVLAVLVEDGTLTDAEIRDQVDTLIGAGFDTTAASIAWMMVSTAGDDTLWMRLRAEADAVLGSDVGTAGDEQLRALDLAGRAVRETLRLHPPGALSPREAAEDLTIDGHPIRRGTMLAWSAYLAGRDRDAWPDPLRFDPDRFVDVDVTQRALMDAAWIPFGGGRRNCIGFALAQMELTLILARMAQRLDVELAPGGEPRPVGMVVNRPQGGVPARISSR